MKKILVHQRLLILRSIRGRQHICNNNINVSLEKYSLNQDDKDDDDYLEMTQMGVKTTRTASLLFE